VPIVFAHLVGFSLGAAFAWVAAAELGRSEGPVVSTPAFRIVVAFAGFLWLPAVGYFIVFHGDWSYLYLAERHPSALDLTLVVLSATCVVSGFLVGAGLTRKRRTAQALAVVGIPAGLVLAALPFSLRRLAVSATYAEFRGGFGTEPIASSVLGKGLLLVGLVLAVGLGWMVWALRAPAEP
jgi:hypothetical protein